jgi:excisionase family DNA binding protein
VASGVTGSGEGVAALGNPSQPLGTTGIQTFKISRLLSPLARIRTPRVTPELQAQGPQIPGGSRLLTVREVAERLRVCTSTVYKLCAMGKLRHVRISNAIRIPETAVADPGCLSAGSTSW